MGHHTDKIVHNLRGPESFLLPKLPEAACWGDEPSYVANELVERAK